MNTLVFRRFTYYPLTLLVALCTLTLSACDDGLGLGEGNGVTGINLFAPITTMRQDDCFGTELLVIATFDDDGQANFTNRATYTSSDDSIVTVDDSGNVFPAIPANPGTATITAHYLEFSEDIDITVQATEVPANAPGSNQGLFVYTPQATIAENTVHSFEVYAVLSNNTTVDVTGEVIMTLEDGDADPDNDVIIDNNFAVPENTSGSVTVNISLCGDTNYPERNIQADFTVSTITDILVSPIVTNNIPEGLILPFQITGQFANGDSADYTAQSNAFSAASDNMGVNYAVAINNQSTGFFSGNVFANEVPANGITQTLEAELVLPGDTTNADPNDDTIIISNNTAISTIASTLQSITFTADNSSASAPGMIEGTLMELNIIATFSTGDIEVTATPAVVIDNIGTSITPEIVTFKDREAFVFAAAGQLSTDSAMDTLVSSLELGSNAPAPSAEASIPLTVYTLSSVSIDAASGVQIVPGSCAAGACRATITFLTADGQTFTQDATKSVNWVSDDVSVAQVSGALGTRGEITFLSTGSANITASFEASDGLKTSMSVSVSN